MLWNNYFSTASDPSLFVISSYDYRLVAISVLLAIALSVVCLHIVDMAQKFEDALQRRLAVLSGSLALGIGVWAMHFVGMLALKLCAVVKYDLTITLLSVLPGLIASRVALNLLVSTEVRSQQLIVSGVLVGAGIGGMHYMGMQAMEMSPVLRYHPLWFGLSILLAVGLAILALWVRYAKPLRGLAKWQRLGLSGTVMGCAISGMHYAAMRAALFIGNAETVSPIAPEATAALTVAIAAGTISFGFSILGLNLFARYREMAKEATNAQAKLSAMVDALKASEKSLEDRVFERTIELRELNRQLEVSQGEQLSMRLALESSHADLQRATKMLEQTGTMAKVGGWEVDLETMKLTWTQETFRIAEIEPPVEPPLEEGINLFAPEVRPVISAAVQAAIDSGTPYDLELPLVVANGRRKWVRTQGFGEMRDGKIVRIYGTFQDIAERKATETALRDQQQLHNAELEERVARRTAELSAALERLEKTQSELTRSERLAGLGAMVAGVSHELNTPIGNSLMVASTLQDLAKGFSGALTKGMTRSALSEFVAEVQDGTDLLVGSLGRAVELVSSFKQVAVDQVSENRRDFFLRQMVDEVLLTLAPTLRRTPHTVRTDIPADIRLQSYPGPFGQVLTNLVNNALIHGLQESLQGNITLHAQILREGWMQFIVQDDGVGIAPEHLNRVFDPFFTTRLGQGGSGLGLNIVHNIVTQVLGGKIRVESIRGQGAQFIVDLPFSAPERK